MALNMEALLKIKADVQGEEAVQGLATKLGGLQKASAAASGGFKTMAGAAGGLVSGLQTLMPLATGAGMVAMAKGAIDAADNMNDLSQKTGVSVEVLSQFNQAAEKSGTTIDGVGNALIKLNRGLVDGKAQEALKGIGISATDAAGKLKPTDQILLEVSKKFASMPDGAQKSAIAMQLFGKSGADIVPMLNMGDKAIKDLAVTMTGDFAKGADEFNDKMVDLQTEMGKLGVSLGTALMPFLSATTEALVGLVNGFNALPAPLQVIITGIGLLVTGFGLLAPAIASVIQIAGALGGLQIGATIAGWAGAIGPAVAAITTALGGLLTWIGTTFIPGLIAFFSGPVGWTVLAVAAVVAMCIAFREPIMNFLTWLWTEFTKAMTVLGQLAYDWFVQPWIDLWNNVLRGPVTTMWEWLTGYVEYSMKTAYALAYQVFVQPWINLWNNVLRDPVTKMWTWLQEIWKNITKFFADNVINPIEKAWNTMITAMLNAMKNLAKSVGNIWDGIVKTIKEAIRSVLTFIVNNMNKIGSEINKLIGSFNKLPGPDIPLVPILTVPQFAQGGYVNRPTLAMVGEGSEGEYIIPESKMAAAASNFLSGRQGVGIIPTNGTASTSGSGTPQITIRTGPVLEFNGEQYVTLADMQRAMRQTAEGVIGRLRTPSARIALGMR